MSPIYAQMLARETEVGPKAAIEMSRKILEACFESQGVSYDEFILAL